jgi:DNA-binding GntR family transcriptional regulator
LEKQLNGMNSLSYYFRVLNFKGNNRGRELYEEHQEMYQYITKRESQKAVAAMMQHIENNLEHFRALNSEELSNYSVGGAHK